MLNCRHLIPLLVLAFTEAAAAQTSVTLSPIFVSGSNAGTGSYSLSSDTASVGADASGGSTTSSSASLNADWKVQIVYSTGYYFGGDKATVTRGGYSFNRHESVWAGATNTPDQGSAQADATNGSQSASASVSGNDSDYDVPPPIDTPMSGSLTDVALSYDTTLQAWVGTKTVFSSSLSANGYLMHPYQTYKDDGGTGFAWTDVSDWTNSIEITVTHGGN